MKFLISFIFISSLFCTPVLAQSSQSDSAFYQLAVYNALAFYQQSSGDQSRLLNGREYKPYRIEFAIGQPFFLSEKFTAGSIVYEDGYYENVQLLYDEVKGMLIAETGVSIELITERIREFTIAGHFFTRLPADSANTQPDNDFYERLYSGKIEIYKKERKFLSEDVSDTEGVRGVVATKTFYYLRKGTRYYTFKNKNSLLDILQDKKAQLQQFIKTKALDYKHDTDNSIAKIAGYYEQLTQ